MCRAVLIRIAALLLATLPMAHAAEPPTVVMADPMAVGDQRLPPLPALRLDTRGVVPVAGKWPERVVVHVMNMPDSHYYWAAFDRHRAVYTLSADTLTPVKDTPPFQGFPAGATVFLMLGTELHPGSLDMGVMLEFATVIVRIEQP